MTTTNPGTLVLDFLKKCANSPFFQDVDLTKPLPTTTVGETCPISQSDVARVVLGEPWKVVLRDILSKIKAAIVQKYRPTPDMTTDEKKTAAALLKRHLEGLKTMLPGGASVPETLRRLFENGHEGLVTKGMSDSQRALVRKLATVVSPPRRPQAPDTEAEFASYLLPYAQAIGCTIHLNSTLSGHHRSKVCAEFDGLLVGPDGTLLAVLEFKNGVALGQDFPKKAKGIDALLKSGKFICDDKEKTVVTFKPSASGVTPVCYFCTKLSRIPIAQYVVQEVVKAISAESLLDQWGNTLLPEVAVSRDLVAEATKRALAQYSLDALQEEFPSKELHVFRKIIP